MESKLTNGLAFIFLSFSVLPDDTHDEKLLLKVDATKTEPYLAMCRIYFHLFLMFVISPVEVIYVSRLSLHEIVDTVCMLCNSMMVLRL